VFLARLGLAPQQQVRREPAKGCADSTKYERVAGVAADTEQEEQYSP
jgi:hypothetical protein